MVQPQDATKEAFRTELRRALHQLYSPTALRQSPLLDLFGLQKTHDPIGTLRRYLTDGVRALRPAASVPLQSQAWRVYHVLTYRYVEQISQREVATDLALSVRHLRRLEIEAVAILGDALLARHGLHLEGLDATDRQGGEATARHENAYAPSRDQELAYLRESLPNEIVDLPSLVESAIQLVRPLADRCCVAIDWKRPDSVPQVGGHRVGIQQVILNLLSAALQTVPGGRVHVDAEVDRREARVSVRAEGRTRPAPSTSAELADNLEMARQLAPLCGGRLEEPRAASGDAVLATLFALPIVEPVPILVIDDNADALRLIERYVAGTRFEFTGVRDPEQGLAIAGERPPKIIVLDIMLPGVDGWELLGRVREHPRLGAVPVLVHTILPQERLALALGAAGFLRKPVSSQTFLKELDRLLDQPSPAAC